MPRIQEMFAFIAEDNGPVDEGIVAFPAGGMWMPMVGADMKRVESLKRIAEEMATQEQKRIRLVKFSVREVLDVIEPKPRPRH